MFQLEVKEIELLIKGKQSGSHLAHVTTFQDLLLEVKVNK